VRASGLSGPSSAQRAIELDDRGQLLALRRGEIELPPSKIIFLNDDHHVSLFMTNIMYIVKGYPGQEVTP
jgi:hypothetical protein